jgi:catechol 2,3-dioxygenase-like lactoylglutathione lyase family enzyme
MIKGVWCVAFQVSNLEKATDFYERILGLEKKYVFSSYVGFQCGNLEIGLVPKKTKNAQARPSPSVEFLVSDVDRMYSELKAKGVKFTKELHDEAWGGREASFTDLDGNTLEIVQIDWEKYFKVSTEGAKSRS